MKSKQSKIFNYFRPIFISVQMLMAQVQKMQTSLESYELDCLGLITIKQKNMVKDLYLLFQKSDKIKKKVF